MHDVEALVVSEEPYNLGENIVLSESGNGNYCIIALILLVRPNCVVISADYSDCMSPVIPHQHE